MESYNGRHATRPSFNEDDIRELRATLIEFFTVKNTYLLRGEVQGCQRTGRFHLIPLEKRSISRHAIIEERCSPSLPDSIPNNRIRIVYFKRLDLVSFESLFHCN